MSEMDMPPTIKPSSAILIFCNVRCRQELATGSGKQPIRHKSADWDYRTFKSKV